jgi:hypothetical protein
MLTRIFLLLLVFLLAVPGTARSAEDPGIRLSGDSSGLTDVFEVDGPWLLDWSVRGKSRLPCNFAVWTDEDASGQPCYIDIRLFDVRAGKYLGTIAQLAGTGRGYKLFEEAGRYRIDVTAENVVWEFLISSIDERTAREIKTRAEQTPPLRGQSSLALRRVAEGAFRSWRPEGDETLFLFGEDETKGYRVTFSPACPGLADATALSFISVFEGGVASYDSVLLDDGTRCYFNRVAPTVFD